jgi:Mg-chelatase subunit ChlI
LGVDGHRADLVILKTARAHAAFQGRTYITQDDILLAAELALPHRLKRGPLQDREVTLDDLSDRLEQVQSQVGAPDQALPSQGEGEPGATKKKR